MSEGLQIVPWLPKELAVVPDRNKVIGGTDISAIMGVNDWRTPYDVWLDKTGRGEELPDKVLFRTGRALEPLNAELYQERYGVKVVRPQLVLQHTTRTWQGGSPDGLHVDQEIVTEFKTYNGFNTDDKWGEDGTQEVPDAYFMQTLWYMLLLEAVIGRVCTIIRNADHRVYPIHRNADLEDAMLTAADNFWHKHILSDTPPEITASDSALAYFKKKHPRNTEPMRIATPEEEGLMVRLANIRRQRLAAEKDEEDLKLRLKVAIGDAEGLESDNLGRITYRASKPSIQIDWQAVALQLQPSPELVNQFTTTQDGSRRFVPQFQS